MRDVRAGPTLASGGAGQGCGFSLYPARVLHPKTDEGGRPLEDKGSSADGREGSEGVHAVRRGAVGAGV